MHFAVAPLHARTCAVLWVLAHTLLSPALGSTLICRWVDENGNTQIADRVPGRYADIATCTDSEQYELTAEQQRDADLRRAAEQSKARSEKTQPPPETPSSASHPIDAVAQPVAKRPSEIVTDTTDCPTWWRIYDESIACFGPYKTLRGIKPEAFDYCNEVPSPEPQCGLRSN